MHCMHKSQIEWRMGIFVMREIRTINDREVFRQANSPFPASRQSVVPLGWFLYQSAQIQWL